LDIRLDTFRGNIGDTQSAIFGTSSDNVGHEGREFKIGDLGLVDVDLGRVTNTAEFSVRVDQDGATTTSNSNSPEEGRSGQVITFT
jgi:hypothetical protein